MKACHKNVTGKKSRARTICGPNVMTFYDPYETWKIISTFLNALYWNVGFPHFNRSDVLCVSISSDCHISSLQGDVVCRKHHPLQDQWHHRLSCLTAQALGLQSKPLVLITTLPKPFNSGDEHPLQTEKQTSGGYFHEVSSQKLIAPQNESLPTVNINYCTHGFSSLSYI